MQQMNDQERQKALFVMRISSARILNGNSRCGYCWSQCTKMLGVDKYPKIM